LKTLFLTVDAHLTFAIFITGGLSAYNLFFKHERAWLIGEFEETTEEGGIGNHSSNSGTENEVNKRSAASLSSTTECSSGPPRKRMKAAGAIIKTAEIAKKRKKIGFALLAQTIAAKWKSMDEASRMKYEVLSIEDRKRYQTELLAYKAQQETEWQMNHRWESPGCDLA
jgi:hypothetical protein